MPADRDGILGSAPQAECGICIVRCGFRTEAGAKLARLEWRGGGDAPVVVPHGMAPHVAARAGRGRPGRGDDRAHRDLRQGGPSVDAGAGSPYDAPAVDGPATQKLLQRRFLVAVVLLVSALFLWMIRPFLTALFLAAIFAGLTSPAYRWVLERTGGREALSSALVVLAVLVGVVGPLSTFLGLVAAQALELSEEVRTFVQQQADQPGGLAQSVQTWVRTLPFGDRLAELEGLFPGRDEIMKGVSEAISTAGSLLVSALAAITRNTATFLLNVFILLYAMFFFLMEGRATLDRILYYVPLDTADEDAVVERFVSVTRATLKGSLVIGALQGALAGLAFWVAGIQGALFWGTVMAVLSVIPGVGIALVWVPAAIWLALGGAKAAATLLALWCALVVGTVDNVLRPRLVGADTKMSDLMIFLGTLGGISLFGLVGFLIGPIVAAIFVTVWDLYGSAFRDVLPPVSVATADELRSSPEE